MHYESRLRWAAPKELPFGDRDSAAAAAEDQNGWFVAPLRFGAGIKGKVAAALAHGVPTVCSSIAAEGIGGEESGLLVCDTPQDWARKITALYNDAGHWRALSTVALNTARNRFSFASGRIKMQALLDKWA